MKSTVSANLAQVSMLSTIALSLILSMASAPAGAQTFAQRHPRRAEVSHRDAHLNNAINRNKGNLGGHYGQLKGEDKAIHAQAHMEAKANGGYLTKGEKHQLNREESGLRHQIHQDKQ